MAFIHIPKGWQLPEGEVTPEHIYLNRRRFMQAMGIAGASAVIGVGCATAEDEFEVEVPPSLPGLYPAKRNENYTVERELTREKVAARHNNFYEFTTNKGKVHELVDKFEVRPWEVEITGSVEKPGVYDVDDLLKRFALEERVYRFRCVEAWAMTVPWTGFPMKALIDYVQPKSSAKYVRMVDVQSSGSGAGYQDAVLVSMAVF